MSGRSHKITPHKVLKERIMKNIQVELPVAGYFKLSPTGDDHSTSKQGQTCKIWIVSKPGHLKKNNFGGIGKQCDGRNQLLETELFGTFHLKVKSYSSIFHICKFYLGFKVILWMLVFALLQEQRVTLMVTCKGELHSSDTCLAASAIITT